jgi:hypothetical protein
MDVDDLVIIEDDLSMSFESRYPQRPEVSSETRASDIGGPNPADPSPPVLDVSNQDMSGRRKSETQGGQHVDMRLPSEATVDPLSLPCSERPFPPLSRQLYQGIPEYRYQPDPPLMAAHPSFELPHRAIQDYRAPNTAPGPSPPVSLEQPLYPRYTVDNVC